MSVDQLFSEFVERSVHRIPSLEVRERTPVDGVPGIYSHLIQQNVLTEFDTCLSRHLSAIRGKGLPAITVFSRKGSEVNTGQWETVGKMHFPTLPHALRHIAAEAIRTKPTATLHLLEAPGVRSSEYVRKVGAEDLHVLDHALELVKQFGPPDYAAITGNFDMLMLEPAGSNTRVTMDMFKGVVALQTTEERFEAPIYGFSEHLKEHPRVREAFTKIHHAQLDQKSLAVRAFQKRAEERIIGFNTALCGNPLEFHRLDAALSLVVRLKAGLGDDLMGLSEDAQITALDWSAMIDRAEAERADRRASNAVIVADQRARVMV